MRHTKNIIISCEQSTGFKPAVTNYLERVHVWDSYHPNNNKNNNNNKLAKEQYIKRHDRVCAQLHFNICKETGVKLDKKHWYEHVPKSIETSQEGKVTILWNQQVLTDRTIPNNEPHIIIRDNEKRTCMLIDAAISGDKCN